MKTVLCYGDSNTWGSISSWEPPQGPSARFDEDTRWGAVMRTALGEKYRVIEEGLCGRTSVYEVPGEEYKNGLPYLLPCLLSHRPLDLVIIMLGSNDVREVFGVTHETLGEGVRKLVRVVKACPTCGTGNVPPKVLLVAPVLITKPEGRQDFYQARGCERAQRLTATFGEVYARVAKEEGCAFFDAKAVAMPAPADGLHMDAASHIRLGRALGGQVKHMLEE